MYIYYILHYNSAHSQTIVNVVCRYWCVTSKILPCKSILALAHLTRNLKPRKDKNVLNYSD
jgi:hypothetical protein